MCLCAYCERLFEILRRESVRFASPVVQKARQVRLLFFHGLFGVVITTGFSKNRMARAWSIVEFVRYCTLSVYFIRGNTLAVMMKDESVY